MLDRQVAPIALGTWVLGGMFQGGVDENEVIGILHAAWDQGFNCVDTAPLYGFGFTEELVGRALKQYGNRDRIILATKCGLGWKGGSIFRDARKNSLMREIDDSLSRLGVDSIDLYQLHWPDPLTPVAETADALLQMQKTGKIRAIGLSNFSKKEIEEFESILPVQGVQIPYNLFERGLDTSSISSCKKKGTTIFGYSALCRGLLSGCMFKGQSFRSDDLRSFDPKCKEQHLPSYLQCAADLKRWVHEKYERTLAELAIRWILDQGIIPIWGPRNREELFDLKRIEDWRLSREDFQEIDQILAADIPHPIGPEFLAPPNRCV